MQLTDQEIAQFNSFYDQACKKMEGLILLNDYRPSSIGFFEKIKANKAIKFFEKALAIYPEHYQSLFFIGKLYQRMCKYEQALYFLELALKYEDINPNIPQEASLVAMELGQVAKAVQLSTEAVKRKPDHIAILGNHAMNLLIAGLDKEAKETIEHAISIDANDNINKNIKSKIEDVIAGKIKRPTFKSAMNR